MERYRPDGHLDFDNVPDLAVLADDESLVQSAGFDDDLADVELFRHVNDAYQPYPSDKENLCEACIFFSPNVPWSYNLV